MNIILTGFMGTGKSCAGTLLAEQLGKIFVDLDACIEEAQGCTISELFARHGEPYFRDKETEMIAEVSARDNIVLATGGGVVLREKNMELLEHNGIVVCLGAHPEIILERVKHDTSRPLLHTDNPLARINELLQERAPFYSRCDHAINTSSLSVKDVVEQIMQHVPKEISVHCGEHTYPIFTGRPYTEVTTFHSVFTAGKKVLILSDKHVHGHYTKTLAHALHEKKCIVSEKVLAGGERIKNLDTVRDVYTTCLEHGLERSSLIIALGGGVIGDIAGFVASTYLRGITYVQIPTTLVAQVDASIGGKTGVDMPQGKNLVGTFYQPKCVWIDPSMLRTLNDDEYMNGLAEVIKYGVIRDAELFSYCATHAKAVLKRDEKTTAHIVYTCARIKADVVSHDEKEAGLRRILNYGHTLGHALETYEGYNGIKHGEAVAVGMAFAAYMSYERGLCSKATHDTIVDVLSLYGFGARIALYRNRFSFADDFAGVITRIMLHDKKVKRDTIHFVLPNNIGAVDIVPLDEKEVKTILNTWGNV